jgi:hypothetical protein
MYKALPVRFEHGAAWSAENMTDDFSDVCDLADYLCTFDPAKGAAAAGDLRTFVGETASGTWKFCAGDAETGGNHTGTGKIDMVTLNLSNHTCGDGTVTGSEACDDVSARGSASARSARALAGLHAMDGWFRSTGSGSAPRPRHFEAER